MGDEPATSTSPARRRDRQPPRRALGGRSARRTPVRRSRCAAALGGYWMQARPLRGGRRSGSIGRCACRTPMRIRRCASALCTKAGPSGRSGAEPSARRHGGGGGGSRGRWADPALLVVGPLEAERRRAEQEGPTPSRRSPTRRGVMGESGRGPWALAMAAARGMAAGSAADASRAGRPRRRAAGARPATSITSQTCSSRPHTRRCATAATADASEFSARANPLRARARQCLPVDAAVAATRTRRAAHRATPRPHPTHSAKSSSSAASSPSSPLAARASPGWPRSRRRRRPRPRRAARRRRRRAPLRRAGGRRRRPARRDFLEPARTLGADAWDAATREGAAMSFDDAIAYGLNEPDGRSHATRPACRCGGRPEPRLHDGRPRPRARTDRSPDRRCATRRPALTRRPPGPRVLSSPRRA